MEQKREAAWNLVEKFFSSTRERTFFERVQSHSVLTGPELKRLNPPAKRRLQPGEPGYDEMDDWRIMMPHTLRETHSFFCATSTEEALAPPDKVADVLQSLYDFERECPVVERVHLIAPPDFFRVANAINAGDAKYPRYPRTPMSLMKRDHTPLAASCTLSVRSAGMCDSLFAVLVEFDVVRWLCRHVGLKWQTLFRYIRRRVVEFCSQSGLVIQNHEKDGAKLPSMSLDASILDRFEFPFPGVVIGSCVALLEYGNDFVDSVAVPLSLVEAGMSDCLKVDVIHGASYLD